MKTVLRLLLVLLTLACLGGRRRQRFGAGRAGAVLQWMFDEGPGAHDGGIYSTDGTPVNATYVTPTSTTSGHYTFNGSSAYIATAVGITSLNFAKTDAFSISLWANLVDDGGDEFLIAKLATGAAHQGYEIFTSNARGDSVNWELMGDSSAVERNTIYGDSDVVDAKWHHIVVLKAAGTGAIGEQHIYVDGKPEGLSTLDSDLGANTIANGNLLDVGARRQISSLYANGQIDDVIVFAKELSADEIKELYNQGRPTHP